MSKVKSQIQQSEPEKRDLRFRSVEMETVAGAEGQKPSVRMSVSSETPVLTYIRMGDQWMYAYEILDHSESSIDRSRCSDGLVIQDTHYGDQVGLIRAPMITDKKFGGIVEFCAGERACEIAEDAANGLRKNSSVGYMADPEKYVVEGEKDGYPLVRCLRWTPYEASFVNVPADTQVGVGRSITETQPEPKTATENERMKVMTPKEMAAFYSRAAKYGITADEAQAILDAGNGRAELDAMIVERQAAQIAAAPAATSKPSAPAPRSAAIVIKDGPAGKDEMQRELGKYSVMNAIRSLSGERVDIGREREISDELAKQRGSGSRGIIVPHSVLASRALTVAGTSSATVATNVIAGEFIDLIRSSSILGDLGVRFMTGLVGNVAIPKMTAGATGYWVAEAAAITGSQPTLGQVTGSPHTCGALVDISRLLLQQSTPDAEMFTRNEIVERLARTIQTAVFAGTGADGQPSAITTAAGIANPAIGTAGTPTYAELLAFVGSIFTNNSAGNAMKWALTGEVWAKLAATATNGAGSPLALDPVSKKMCGYEYVNPCEDLPANSLWFGDWSTVNVGVWGAGVDIIIDQSTLSSAGGLRIVGLQDVDVMVRNGKALAFSTAVTA